MVVFNVACLPGCLKVSQLTVKNGLAVTVAGGQLKVLVGYGTLFLFLDYLELFFLIGYFRWYLGCPKMYARPCFVHSINGLVGLRPVSDVAFCQFDTRQDGIVGIGHMMMVLIAVFDVMQYL